MSKFNELYEAQLNENDRKRQRDIEDLVLRYTDKEWLESLKGIIEVRLKQLK
jgi:hypothetical protein